MEADGAPFTPSLCQCSILRVFKATATQIRKKLEQTLESMRIELGTSSTEGRAFTNCATCLLLADCGAYRGVKLLEHAMKIMERMMEKRNRKSGQEAFWVIVREMEQ